MSTDADHRAELAKLADLPDDQIDTADIPEAPADSWRHARRGALVRKREILIVGELPDDVIADLEVGEHGAKP